MLNQIRILILIRKILIRKFILSSIFQNINRQTVRYNLSFLKSLSNIGTGAHLVKGENVSEQDRIVLQQTTLKARYIKICNDVVYQ